MKLNFIKILSNTLFLFLIGNISVAQEMVVDQIVAKVGNYIILQSDVEAQYQQYKAQGFPATAETRCQIFEDLLFQKLLLNQAELDSVEVTETQVEGELDRRVRFFIEQIGSEKKLEEYYNKSILEIKAEFKTLIRDQLLVQTMQGKITEAIKATPSDVRNFFDKIPKDSLPLIGSEIEVAQIVKKPPVSPEEKRVAREKIEQLKLRIEKGEDFGTLAILYSEDPGSAKNGGELGFFGRGAMVPEFEAVAYKLKGKEVSEIVESPYGFHIIQLIERKGEQINARHILISPKINTADHLKAQQFLDSLVEKIQKDSISFENAALKYSDDEESKNNGGLMINQMNNSTKFEASQLDPSVFFVIDKLKVGEISKPALMQNGSSKAYRILKLKSRTEPHRANLKDDYQKIQEMALQDMQDKAIEKWIRRKKQNIYIQIGPDFKNCNFSEVWEN